MLQVYSLRNSIFSVQLLEFFAYFPSKSWENLLSQLLKQFDIDEVATLSTKLHNLVFTYIKYLIEQPHATVVLVLVSASDT
jgi:hypothetical protein